MNASNVVSLAEYRRTHPKTFADIQVIEWPSFEGPQWELFPGSLSYIRAVEAGEDVGPLQALALEAMFSQEKRAEYEIALADLRRRYPPNEPREARP